MSRVLSLKPSYYDALKRLTLELSGVQLGADHAFLIETRLATLSRREGFETLTQMIDELFSGGDTRLAINVVSSLMDREQRFFADRDTLEQLEDVILPALHEAHRGGTLRVLSFGCSSGQEAYSLAILLDKMKDVLPNMDVDLRGVDYPSVALDRAKRGVFTHFEVQRGLPIRDLIANFDIDGENWVAKPELRKTINFEEFHLLSNAADLGLFDLVLFRRKLPHYSSPAQVRVLRGLSMMVKPQGYLMLGSGEDLNHINYGFDTVSGCPSIYCKREAQAVADIDETLKIASGKTTFDNEAGMPEDMRQKPASPVVSNPLEKVEAKRIAEQTKRNAREKLFAKYENRPEAKPSKAVKQKAAVIANPLEKVEAERLRRAERRLNKEKLAQELRKRRASKIIDANTKKDVDLTPRSKRVKIANPLEKVDAQRQAAMKRSKARKELAEQLENRNALKRRSMVKSKSKSKSESS